MTVVAFDRHQVWQDEFVPNIPEFRRWARRLTGDDLAAEDLLQHCLLRMFRLMGSYSPGTNSAAWGLTIINNEHKRSFEKKRVTEELFDQLDDDQHPVTQEDPGFSEVMQEALSTLPTDMTEVLMLTEVYRFTNAEAAERLGVAEGTVFSRRHRARQKLREALVGLGYDGTPVELGEAS